MTVEKGGTVAETAMTTVKGRPCNLRATIVPSASNIGSVSETLMAACRQVRQ